MPGSYQLPKLERLAALARVFTPSGPVSSRDLFQGRMDQVVETVTALQQPGQHVVLYGERGVGKTSLANLLREFVRNDPGARASRSVRVNCSTPDDFRTIWSKVLREAGVDVPDDWRVRPPDADEVRTLLADVQPALVVVLDEYDRVEDDDALTAMADTLKAMSDHLTPSKVVLVGVATSVEHLVGEHESVQRCLREVLLPRMSEAEMTDILDAGFTAVTMTAEPAVVRRILRLAEGLPTYVHLLALEAGTRAIQDDRDQVVLADLDAAVVAATRRWSLLHDYQTAVQSPRRENLFSQVLVACALAEKNPLGQFTAAAVRAPLSRVMGRPYEITGFARHLKQFTEADRGAVLVQEGPERRRTYRFRNPLLQPFTLMTALSEELLPEDLVAELFGPDPSG